MNWPVVTRLMVAGRRADWIRLIGMSAGVMVGVALALTLIAASNGLAARSERGSWVDLPTTQSIPGEETHSEDPGVEVVTSPDHFRGHIIHVLRIGDAAKAGVSIPGVETPPAPGQYVASPALIALTAGEPADQFSDRYGTLIGTISASGLEGPEALVLVAGTPDAELEATGDAQRVEVLEGTAYATEGYRIVALIGAIAVMVPVLLLIAIVTDLGGAQRAERFAALRLMGASPGHVATIAALETAATTVVGGLLGIVLYVAMIPVAARVPVASGAFYTSDLQVGPGVAILTVLVAVLCATGVAWWRALRADVGPLGAARERPERRPGILSLTTLGAGLLLLFLGAFGIMFSNRLLLIVGGFLLTSLGLLQAGTFATAWVARRVARRARTASQLMAFGRVARHPRASFRAISGVVVAAYFVTVFAVGMTAAVGTFEPEGGEGALPTTTLTAMIGSVTADELTRSVEALTRVDGVTGVAVAYLDPNAGVMVVDRTDARTLGLPNPEDAAYLSISDGYLAGAEFFAEPLSVSVPSNLNPWTLFVMTDGTTDGLERARSACILDGPPLPSLPTTLADLSLDSSVAVENEYAGMAYTGIVLAAALSAVSLAVATLASLMERRRVLGLLRLMGLTKQTLRRTLALEAALPVATIFGGALVMGVVTAWAVVTGASGGGRHIHWPGMSYYVALGVCGILMVLAVAVTVRAGTRLTGLTSTRFE